MPKEAKDFSKVVYAELTEMYLLKEDFEASKKYAKLGLEKLSMLEWVVQSEPLRISDYRRSPIKIDSNFSS